MTEVWREPSAEERELLRVVLLADFPERETVRAQIWGTRVADDCGCGCGSLRFEVDATRTRLPKGWALQLSGETDLGCPFDIYIPAFDDDGQVHIIDITPLSDVQPFGRVMPSSLRQFDVTQEGAGFQSLEARLRTILEEESRRGESE